MPETFAPQGLELPPYCVDIQSKKLLLSSAVPRVESDILDASRSCWCRRTMRALGPDREPVEPEACQVGRSCFRSVLGTATPAEQSPIP